MRAFVLGLLGSCLIAASAVAQTSGENGRFSMTPAEGGFLRLDTRTGEVALCRPKGDTVDCRSAPNESSPLASEIDRLAKENAELRARLAGQLPPPPPPGAAPPSRTQQEMDRALDYAERFMRRMMRIMREEATPPDRT